MKFIAGRHFISHECLCYFEDFFLVVLFSFYDNSSFSFSGLGGVLIVCPTTLLHQWVKEFHKWFPLCRVAVLHSSGAFAGKSAHLVRAMAHPRRYTINIDSIIL